ncbi:MDR family MFS transporter [Caldalkalibacillus salinus]|uniref:MDR family MFS transporter n=1 Tax=Caldalkalibacillus salinus TaxID=2803787 RepID=UPI0019216C77|nr:MDR family MFS transporter [Caldalkalibacillus salinus]
MRTRRGFVIAGLLAGMLMAGMDGTVVATALPTIISDLGGLDLFVWVTSAYMVMMMASTPIFGKLSDMYGRKLFFMIGLALFLAGSILCGMAGSMIQLIIYRGIQGIGGGALMPIAFTIVADLFPVEKRGKMMGIVGAIFGISSIFGPLLGALVTEAIGWRWVFFINLPIGLLSFLLTFLCYRESMERVKQKIDGWGAVTLVLSVVALMLALQLGGDVYAWASPFIIGLFTLFAVFLTLFLWIENKTADPILSFDMFKDRLFASSCAAALFVGAAYISAITYIPMFVQGVFGGSATQAGYILTPMMLGSVFGSQAGGFLTTKLSYKQIMLLASAFFVPGILLLSTLDVETARYWVTIYMALTGFGAGFSFSVLSMAAMHNFDYRRRGSASATNRFAINLGMTLGITVFGIVQRTGFERELAVPVAGGQVSQVDPRTLLNPEGRDQFSGEALHQVISAFSSSITLTFVVALVPAVLFLLSVTQMSHERAQTTQEPSDS